MKELEFIYKRKSVRKFKPDMISKEDIENIIRAAGAAPSATNSQNWFFYVITNKEKILMLKDVVISKQVELLSKIEDEKTSSILKKYIKYATFFENAPVVIIPCISEYNFLSRSSFENANISEDELKYIFKDHSEIQNIGAAIENLVLAAAALGYGTCWMTAASYANFDIAKFLGTDLFPVAIIPIGYEEGNSISPVKKDVSEIYKIIE